VSAPETQKDAKLAAASRNRQMIRGSPDDGFIVFVSQIALLT
jgi:hypothetical protein